MTMVGLKRKADWVDTGLVLLFLIGIYTNLSVRLGQGLPVPMLLAGIAGLSLLVKHAQRIQTRHLVALLVVILLYMISILCASDYRFLIERLKGFVQLSYSLIIGYGLFITVLQFNGRRLARIFLGFCLAIIIGCALENYTDFKAISDAYRNAVFESGVYGADLRDDILYGRIRPKLFTSEPSAVTFYFTLFAFVWFALSSRRLKLPIYLALLAAGFFLMRGPTLLLGFLLVIPYELFLASRKVGIRLDYHLARLAVTLVLAVLLLVAFYVVGTTLYAERLDQIARGGDTSFFMRVTGPALIAFQVMSKYPIAGAGLTGDEFITDIIVQTFETSPDVPAQLSLTNDISSVLSNFFWLHWTYLGVVWGSVMLFALVWFVRVLGTPSVLFWGAVWIVLSQATGAYVSPPMWVVLYLSCAVALMHQRARMMAPVEHPSPRRRPLIVRGTHAHRPSASAS